MIDPMEFFFKPAGVALVGASSNPNKLSHGILKNLIEFGYQGKIYPVNPGSQQILGLACYPDIPSIPDPVDLAVIVLPAPMVIDALIACGKRGIKAVTVISGGFKEVGSDGAEIEKKCVEIAGNYKMRMVGPNCVGTIDLYSGLNTTFIRGVPDKGHIGFISQSGAVCGAIVDLVCGKRIGFSHFISLGNEADVTETDMIAYLGQEPNTSVIACYVEAIRNGQRFIEVCRSITPHKPIVLLKAGQTDAGARAVSSHTGSLAGSVSAYEAALKQSGVIMVKSASELINVSYAFSTQPFPIQNRVVIITNSGGPAALASDSLATHGIQLANLSDSTQTSLKTRLNPSAQVFNPVDMLGGAEPGDYGFAVEQCIADPLVDSILVIHVPTSIVNPDEVANAIGKAATQSPKPVLACIMGDFSIGQARGILTQYHIPTYPYPEQIGPVFGAMTAYNQIRTKISESPVQKKSTQIPPLKILISDLSRPELGEAQIRPLLAYYKIPLIQAEIARSEKEAGEIVAKMRAPVAMKIVSPEVLHKSDAGGIKLNIKGFKEAQDGYREILANVQKYNPQANLEGIIIEPMAPKGHEVIIGMKRDPQFGPLIMFGLGGIYVELFKDVSFRVAPFSKEEAYKMIRETKAGLLLNGMRGFKPADIEAVVDCIIKLAQISLDYPEIQEIEINPLLVLPEKQGAVALDARAILV